MRENHRRTSLLAVLCLVSITLGWSAVARAVTIDLVVNGEFEDPLVSTNQIPECNPAVGFGCFPTIPGWSASPGGFELWSEGVASSPNVGSDGLPTGQHNELNPSDIFSQSFLVPTQLLDTTATLTFDAWLRSSGDGFYTVLGSVSGALLTDETFDMNTTTWTRNQQLFVVQPGETITLSFEGTGTIAAVPHLDQVAFVVDVIPEPSTALLVGIGLAGLGTTRKRRLS